MSFDDARSSEPTPSPVPPAPVRAPTGSHAAAVEPLEHRALRVALDARDMAREMNAELGRDVDASSTSDVGSGLRGRLCIVESTIGRPANVIRKTPATGIVLVLEEVLKALADLRTELAADRKQRDDQAAALAKRKAPFSKVGWIVISVLVTCVVAGGYAAFIAFLMRHWR